MRHALTVAAAILLAASAAHADTRTIARAGAWEAFGGTTTQGRPLCGVSTTTTDGRYVGVKMFQGNETFTIQVGWKQWTIKDGAKQDVHMMMDGNPRWRASASGMHFGDGDAGLEFNVASSQLLDFVRQFTDSNRLLLQFPGGGAQDWAISLAGTTAVSTAFSNCIGNL